MEGGGGAQSPVMQPSFCKGASLITGCNIGVVQAYFVLPLLTSTVWVMEFCSLLSMLESPMLQRLCSYVTLLSFFPQFIVRCDFEAQKGYAAMLIILAIANCS